MPKDYFPPKAKLSDFNEERLRKWLKTQRVAKIDNDAFHGDEDSEFSSLTEKTTPVDADLIAIEDSADGNNKKKAQLGNLPGRSGGFLGEHVIGSDNAHLEVSSISTDHKALKIVAILRGDNNATSDSVDINVGNGAIDTGSNYRWLRIYDGSSENQDTTTGDTKIRLAGGVPGATADAGEYGVVEITIEDYASTSRQKFFSIRSIHRRNSSSIFVMDHWGRWESTSAIDQIRLTPGAGSNWKGDSLMRVYAL